MPDTTDPAASALDEERAILAAAAADAADQREWRVATQIYGTLKVPTLIAAVEAALKLPAEWRQESEALRDAAGKVWEDAPDAPGVRLKHAYAAGYAECAKALEAAITAALAGKEAGDGDRVPDRLHDHAPHRQGR